MRRWSNVNERGYPWNALQREYREHDFARCALHVGGKIDFSPGQARDVFVSEPLSPNHLSQDLIVRGSTSGARAHAVSDGYQFRQVFRRRVET
jgi:hypothetical protein